LKWLSLEWWCWLKDRRLMWLMLMWLWTEYYSLLLERWWLKVRKNGRDVVKIEIDVTYYYNQP
jgi:hypothetical protein